MAKTTSAIVITGDIIASSKLSTAARKKLQNKMDSFIKKISASLPDFKAEQFRGDSVQCILTKNKSVALRTAVSLQCHCIVI